MTFAPVDPAAIRLGLERQLELLAPVAVHLQAASAEAAPLVADDWRGPAATAANDFTGDLRAELRAAADEADDALRLLRLHIALLS